MKESETGATRPGLHKVVAGVYVAALMSPADVARALTGREDMPAELQRWTLCGDVSPIAFAWLVAGGWPANARERMTVLTSPAGFSYWVVTHQLSGFQHRFLVPLYDDAVCACLRALGRGESLGYSMAGEGDRALVWASNADSAALAPVHALRSAVAEGQEESALEDYASAVRELTAPDRIPSIVEGIQVRHASVSAVAPKQLLDRMDARFGLSS
jgi:hypothetical protein